MSQAYFAAVEQSDDPVMRDSLVRAMPLFQNAAKRRDSLLARGPSIRYSNDSHARVDSAVYTYLLLSRIGALYYTVDTTNAVFAYFDVLPWLEGVEPRLIADHARRFAAVLGDAVNATHSPNMVRLSYQAFEHAKRLALDHGDPHYIQLADSSYKAVVRRVLTMPDSVRTAFGPAPERPARVPWVLVTLAAAFIATSVAGGWGWNT